MIYGFPDLLIWTCWRVTFQVSNFIHRGFSQLWTPWNFYGTSCQQEAGATSPWGRPILPPESLGIEVADFPLIEVILIHLKLPFEADDSGWYGWRQQTDLAGFPAWKLPFPGVSTRSCWEWWVVSKGPGLRQRWHRWQFWISQDFTLSGATFWVKQPEIQQLNWTILWPRPWSFRFPLIPGDEWLEKAGPSQAGHTPVITGWLIIPVLFQYSPRGL